MITPYYESDGITLYLADMREVVPSLVFNCIVTDPPYGETSLDWDHWVNDWPGSLLSSTTERQMWCFGSMRLFLAKIQEFAGWKFAQDLVWEKHNGSGFRADRFKRVHEHALQFYTGEWANLYHRPVFCNDATKRTVRTKNKPPHLHSIDTTPYQSFDGGPRLMRSVIYARSCHGRADHPTQKPLDILGPLIEYSCPPGGSVLDPFAGAGSTLVAARMLGRRAIGIEAREECCAAAVDRLRQDSLFEMAISITGKQPVSESVQLGLEEIAL